MSIFKRGARSVGGVTVGNAWLRNNPNLRYPEGHEQMSDNEIEAALRVPDSPLIAGDELDDSEGAYLMPDGALEQ